MSRYTATVDGTRGSAGRRPPLQPWTQRFDGGHAADQQALHHHAYDRCFSGNPVKTAVRCEPVLDAG
jgi:hypothetical protein